MAASGGMLPSPWATAGTRTSSAICKNLQLMPIRWSPSMLVGRSTSFLESSFLGISPSSAPCDKVAEIMPRAKNEPSWKTPRAFSRFLLDIRIVIRGKEILHGRTKDLGEGGVGATIPGNMAIGDTAEV